MPKISLIGAGWLGRPLAVHWLNKGYEVCVTTTREEKRKALEKEGLKAECWTLEAPAPTWVLDSDAVVFTIPPRPQPEVFAKQSTDFFNQLKKSGFAGRIFFCSSISVLRGETSSAKSLHEVEKNLKEMNFRSTVICRLGGLYGDKRHPSRVLAKKSEILPGGRRPVNLLHLDEGIELFDKLLRTTLSNYEIIHAVNDVEASKSQFYPLCAKLLNLSPVQYQETGKAELNQGQRISNAKLKKQLGFTFGSCPLV